MKKAALHIRSAEVIQNASKLIPYIRGTFRSNEVCGIGT